LFRAAAALQGTRSSAIALVGSAPNRKICAEQHIQNMSTSARRHKASSAPRDRGSGCDKCAQGKFLPRVVGGKNLLDRCEQQREDGERNDHIERSEQDLAHEHARKPVAQSQQAPHWRRAKTISMKPSAAQAEAASFQGAEICEENSKQK
jgi:hypothetical protein